MRAPLLITIAAVAVTASVSTLPDGITRDLDHSYRGWKLAAVAPQVLAWFSDYKLPFEPNHVTADFDGDGKKDHAIRIEHNGQALTIAYLDRGASFEKDVLSTDAPDPFTYLLLYKKGEKDFDFTKLKPFRHAHDGIGLMYFDKTPFTFRYIRGKFEKMLAPSDEEMED
jgi:hypothetical protein